MKKKLGIIAGISVCCCLVLGGCSSNGTADNGSAQVEVNYADEDFMASLAKGLEARWKLNDEYEEKYKDAVPADGSDEQVEAYTSWVEAELTELSQYRDSKFKDSKLKEKAIAYINCLDEQAEAIDYTTVDAEKCYELWNNAYNKRSKLIEDFVNDFGLTVSDEYQSILKEMVTNSNLVKADEEAEQAVKDMLAAAKFEVVESSDGWKTYNAVIENTTGTDISSILLDINLLDADGVIVSTEYDDIANFKQGQKAKIEFATDKDFASTEVTASYWE